MSSVGFWLLILISKYNHLRNPTNSPGEILIFVNPAQDKLPCPLPSPLLWSPVLLYHCHLKKFQQEFSCLSLFFILISRHSIFLTSNCSNCLIIYLTQLWFTAVKCSSASGWTFHSIPLVETKVEVVLLGGKDGQEPEHHLPLQMELDLVSVPM